MEVNGNGNKITFTSAVNEAAYGSRHGILVNADDVTITDLVVEMDANTNDLTWTGTYGIQVYDATGVVINNYTGTKADAALMLNGSEVELTGTTTVTGNEFGGIEVSKGTAPNNSKLTVAGTVVSTDEEFTRPAIWVENGQGEVIGTGLIEKSIAPKSQTFYFVNEESTKSIKVSSLDELKYALTLDYVEEINITKNITDVAERIVIDRKVEVNGNGNKITFTSAVNEAAYGSRHGILVNADDVTITDLVVEMDANTNDLTWTGTYGIQVFESKGVILNNITATKADGGLFANDSTVTLTGTITLSGNEFGGMEVSNGTATLNAKGATIVNTSERYAQPTIWTDSENAVVNSNLISAKIRDGQKQYYLEEANTTLNNIEDFKVALSIKTINTLNIGANFTGLTERIVIDRKVEVNGNGNKITFTSAVNEAAYGSRHGILVNADDVTITDLVVEMDANTNDLTWTGTYGIQVYDATGVVINNYTGTKADAALMLNGSEVELTGTTTVTGNEFGGIEVSKGTAPNNSKLTVAGTVVSTDEDVNCPAIWLIDGQGTILGGTFYTKANVTDQGVAQTYYFLNELLATN